MKEKNVTGILAIFLGGLGVHRFYLGQIGMGILYLLFSWSIIPTLIGIIEGVIFLTMPREEFDFKYNYDQMPEERKEQYHQEVKEKVEGKNFKEGFHTKPVHMPWEHVPTVQSDDDARREKIVTTYPKGFHDKMLDRIPWVGMTKEMVIDTFGQPLAEDTDADGNRHFFYDYYENEKGEEAYALELVIQDEKVVDIQSS